MRKLKSVIIVSTALLFTASCNANYAAQSETGINSPLSQTRFIPRHSSGEPMPFFATDNAKADLDAALEAALASGKKPLLVMGANWCHDSRALAAHFETRRFAQLIESRYQPVYIDVGQKDRNVDIAQRYGYKTIEGTPTVIILSNSGEVLNKKTAPTWRNAASRNADDVYAYFSYFSQDNAQAE